MQDRKTIKELQQVAKKAGKNTFNPHRACVNGHNALRYTCGTAMCVQCVKDRDADRYENDREALNQKSLDRYYLNAGKETVKAKYEAALKRIEYLEFENAMMARAIVGGV